MAYISNEVINEIRNKTDIVDVVSRYVNLTKRGKNYIGVCPFHDDHSPSMSVSPEKQIFTCFSCGASGNVFTFVSDFEKISFMDAVKLLGDKLGINIGSNIITKKEKDDYIDIYNLTSKFYQNSLFTSLGKNAIEYLENRKIDKETIKKFGIGLSIQKVSLTEYLKSKKYNVDKLIDIGLTNENGNDIFINRIMFPIHDLSGNVVAFSGRIYNTKDNSKYINTKETDKFKKGKILYNYHIAREYLKKNDSVILMEGQMDVIRSSTVGINNCIATMGTALTKDHRSILKNMTDNIILCFDGDAAGEKATNAAIELLEDTNINIRVVRLPNNMDPDEYILKEGADSFKEQIKNATSLVDYKMEILKKNKNLNDIKDISAYLNSAIKELVNINDDIAVELNLKKLSTNYNVDYNTLRSKYDNLKNKKKEVVSEIKPKKVYDKYGKAQTSLIYYMLKSSTVINMVEKRVGYFPDKNIRELSNEIIYYFHKYGIINVADFISYIAGSADRDEILHTLKEIIAMDKEEDFKLEEIEDYIFVINEYHKEVRVEELNKKLREEKDPNKQAKISLEIMNLRKGVRNGTRD